MSFSWTKKFKPAQTNNIFEWGSQAFYDQNNNELTTNNFLQPDQLILFDEKGNKINSTESEFPEQCLAYNYIKPYNKVLELGARYGSVSCVINQQLFNSSNQVSVEPDSNVWSALEDNLKRNGCSNVKLHKGFVSKKSRGLLPYGYAATSYVDDNSSITSLSVEEIEELYEIKFDTLVADCEGFLEEFFDEHPHLYDQLQTVIFEADYPTKCNYEKIRNSLKEHGFEEIIHGFQNVYTK